MNAILIEEDIRKKCSFCGKPLGTSRFDRLDKGVCAKCWMEEHQ
jgi:recombinational DNA repair protein (RecF pathway)